MKFTSYNQAREYLESFIRPMLFQKVTLKDGQEIDPLDRMRYLLKLLGDPHCKFPSVVVSGSAGKGSTAYLISHILATAGKKTGLSISPHLQKIAERMQINGKYLPDNAFVSYVNEIVPVVEEMKTLPIGEPSYFELLLAIAFLHFAKETVDIAVIEVGIEGKYDGTNVLDPLISVLTNIELDHTEILGDTIEKIAEEAVQFIKNKHQVVITGVKQPSVINIVNRRADAVSADLVMGGRDFTFTVTDERMDGTVFEFSSGKQRFSHVYVSLVGGYQAANAAYAITAVLQLRQFGFIVSEKQIRNALNTATFRGRFELIDYTQDSKSFTLILDGAHNPAKMQAFVTALRTLYPDHKKIFLISFKKGKQVAEMVDMIVEQADAIVVTEFHRTIDYQKNASMATEDIEQIVVPRVESSGIPLYRKVTAASALQIARNVAVNQKKALIIVTGSLYLVGEILEVVPPVTLLNE